MNSKHVCVLTGALLLMLAGCGGSESGFDASPGLAANGVEAIFSADRDGDPSSISDDAALGASIERVFGDENAEPLSVNPTDTIGDVLDRAKNG